MAKKEEKIEVLEVMKEPEKKENKMQGETIGTIIDRSKNGPAVALIVIFLLIAVVIFLPYLNNIIDTEDIINYFTNNKVNTTNTIDPEKKEQVYYSFNETLKLVENNITYDNFKLEKVNDNNYLVFNVYNANTSSYNLNEANIYFELYNLDKTLLQRIKVSSLIQIPYNQKETLKFLLKDNINESINTISLINYKKSDYPIVVLNKNEDNISELVCTNENNTIKYQFEDDKLVKILDHFKYSSTGDLENYSKLYLDYKEKSNKINEFEGMTSTIVESDNSFIFNASFDLTKAKIKLLNNQYYYEKGEVSKVISFELEASRYNCN